MNEKNSSWNLKLDNVSFYAYLEEAFSKEECEQIIEIGVKKGLIKSSVGFEKKIKLKIRNSKISWLYPHDNMDWVFRKTTDIVLNLNNQFFNFNLFGINEGFQFTNYKAPYGKLSKHTDRINNTPVRKLSISIQLTDPSKYQGGDLILHGDNKGTVMPKKQGTLIIFPSFVLHEVTSITKGERNSLVTWVTGEQFK